MSKEKDFNTIYNSYWYHLYAYSYNITRSKEIAEDVTQDVFIDLWNRYDTLEIENYKAYLYKAVKFQCSKRLRNISFNEIQLDKVLYVLELLEDQTSANAEKRDQLLEKIDSTASQLLPEKCLQIFKLRFKEQLSYKEIAGKLNISVSTVENQINKALKILKAADIYNSEMLAIAIILLNTSHL